VITDHGLASFIWEELMVQSLKERLRSGEPLLGCFVMLPAPAIIEMAAYAGFDFVVIDAEHGASHVESIEHQLRAADAAGISAVVRTVGMTPGEILRVLDAGAEGIVVPHVKTVEDVKAIVSASHYPPHGIRGLATTARAGRHGFITVAEHLARASARTLVIPQIEDAAALENVPAIASVEGVDALFIGPADLSISLGHPGNPGHPSVVKAIDEAAASIRQVGRIPMIFTKDAPEVVAMSQRGINVAVYSTTSLISGALRSTVEAVRQTRA
jgi:4-hydroxy-2-oxoheptanedioate aldolase